jgi:plasmid stabilization system protein ParE
VNVRIAPIAVEQIGAVRAWWRLNRRGGQELFDRELRHALELIQRAPRASKRFDSVDGAEVRRVLLPRSRYAIYFVIEETEILVVALWHQSRGSGPPL